MDEVADHVLHKAKGHSFLSYRFCVDDPCPKCQHILESRQRSRPGWCVKSLLAPLAFNNYLLPWPELKPEQEDAVEEGMSAQQDVQEHRDIAAVAKVEAARVELQNAIQEANFLAAHRLKEEIQCLEAGMHSASPAASPDARGSSDASIASPLRCQADKPKRPEMLPQHVNVDGELPTYFTLREMIDRHTEQSVIHVPIRELASAVGERLFHCECSPTCRYVARTKTEMSRHALDHELIAATAAKQPADLTQPSWTFSLAGALPVPERRPARRRAAAGDSPEQDLLADMAISFVLQNFPKCSKYN